MGAGDQVDAGGDHGGGMDQRRHRRRAGHCIGQPDLQRQLCALTHRPAEQQQGDGGGHARTRQPMRARGVHRLLYLQRAEFAVQQEQADGHRRVPDAGGDEGLARRVSVGGFAIEEADQQVAAQAHAFPAEVQAQQVVAEHQQQHRGHEQVHVGEEATVARIAGHVAGREQMDQRTDAGDYAQHRQRQAVQIQRDRRRETVHRQPLPQPHRGRHAIEVEPESRRHQRRRRHRTDAEQPHHRIRGFLPQQQHGRRDQRRGDQRREQGLHRQHGRGSVASRPAPGAPAPGSPPRRRPARGRRRLTAASPPARSRPAS